jgi:hypothetical protein
LTLPKGLGRPLLAIAGHPRDAFVLNRVMGAFPHCDVIVSKQNPRSHPRRRPPAPWPVTIITLSDGGFNQQDGVSRMAYAAAGGA